MYLPHVVCGWLCSSDMVLLVMWYRWYRYSGDMVLLVNRCGTVVSEGGALTPFVLPAAVAWMCVCVCVCTCGVTRFWRYPWTAAL